MISRSSSSRYTLVYNRELVPFLTGEGPKPVGRRALVLLADDAGHVEAAVACSITRCTNSRRSTVLFLLDGEVDGEPITSVAYSDGDSFPITSAGRHCVIHVDNAVGDHVEDMLNIWTLRLQGSTKAPVSVEHMEAASP